MKAHRCRLVVGTINLVEAIAHLTQFKPGKESLKRRRLFGNAKSPWIKLSYLRQCWVLQMADSEGQAWVSDNVLRNRKK